MVYLENHLFDFLSLIYWLGCRADLAVIKLLLLLKSEVFDGILGKSLI